MTPQLFGKQEKYISELNFYKKFQEIVSTQKNGRKINNKI